jgi:hypothetical protein
MKTAVETIFVGKDHQYNRRFLQMCSHHLVEPVACTPASGWKKGQVENQVGLVRERFFTPRLRFKSYDELNAWLMDKCIAWTKAHGHPERPGQTIWEVFEEERPKLIPYRGRFDGFHALPASVSKTCLVRFDNNKYSVSASAVGRPVDIHAYAERVVIRQDGRIVAEHPRLWARRNRIRSVALRAGSGSQAGRSAQRRAVQGLGVATALERVRRKLTGSDDGDRQMVKILAPVLTDGLPAVEAACLQALSEGVHSADVVINILARQRDPGPAATILTPDDLRLRHAPPPTAPVTINSGALEPWNEAKHDERPQALWDEERLRRSTRLSCATWPAADSSPNSATSSSSAGPAQARRIWPSPSRAAASALDRAGASSPPSISSISSRPKVEPDARDAAARRSDGTA